MCWFQLWDYDPPPYAQTIVDIHVVLVPYIDDVLVLFMGMIGGWMKGLDVSFGREILHGYYVSNVWERIGPSMITTLGLLFPYGKSHLRNLSTWEVPLMSRWEEYFYELPLWKVIHFVWMIAWRLELHMGINFPHIFSFVLAVSWGQATLGRGRL